MTPEEYGIIRDVFARIRAFPAQRDDEARKAVDAELRANPDAGVGLIQLVVGLEAQRAQLQVERDRLAAQLSSGQRGTAQTGGLFTSVPNVAPPPPQGWNQQQPGPWGQQAQPTPPPPPPAQGWNQQPQGGPWSQPQQPQGGSFLRNALGAATGVAGGLFAYSALSNLFGGHMGGGLFGNPGVTEVINQTTYVDQQPGSLGGYDPGAGSYDPGVVDAGYDDTSFGNDFGGGDDSSFV